MDMPLAEFEERLRYMPLPDQVFTIEQMLDSLFMQHSVVAAELAVLKEQGYAPTTKKMRAVGAAIASISSDRAFLNKLLKKANNALHESRWQAAVSAVFGEEGRIACREWVIQTQAEQEVREIPADLRPYMQQYGLT